MKSNFIYPSVRYGLFIAVVVNSFYAGYAFSKETKTESSTAISTAPAINISYTVPSDITDPANSNLAAEYAWQQFIALTWPAKVNPAPVAGLSEFFRGQPDTTAHPGSTGPNGTVVWETFYHRNELYPNYADSNLHTLPDPNASPSYPFGSTVVTPATSSTKLNLFNNLDEASEISLANMYFTPLANAVDELIKQYPKPTPAQQQLITNAGLDASLIYEAKGNSVVFNYVKENSFNNAGTRRQARAQSIKKINNTPTTGKVFELPNGSVEIKATWRRYNPKTDNLKDFHWATALYYTTPTIPYSPTASNLIAHNDIVVLVALHIIQKTPNVPTFTYATFEHVSNEVNGFRFINTNPKTYTPQNPPNIRPLPDAGIIKAIRQYPIPGYVVDLNSKAQNQLRNLYGNDVVWANYQLIGVQAVVTDDPTAVVPAQQFFLSNFATETNDSLQFFQGGLSGTFANVPNPDVAHVFVKNPITSKYEGHTSGGCKGCHGSQGQNAGGDFSVIAATGNASFSPEPVMPYPGGVVVDQNSQGFPLPHTK